MAAGLAQPQQRAQDSVDGTAVEAAKFQAPVRDFPEFDKSVLGADLVLAVVEVTLDRGEMQPVNLLCLWGNLNLEGVARSSNVFEQTSSQKSTNPATRLCTFLTICSFFF